MKGSATSRLNFCIEKYVVIQKFDFLLIHSVLFCTAHLGHAHRQMAADLRNLALETVGFLERNGVLHDVDFVTDGTSRFSFHDFLCDAKKINYYPGFGTAHISTSLTILGMSGWWATRQEYDGSEKWKLHRLPMIPDEYMPSTVNRWLVNRKSSFEEGELSIEKPSRELDAAIDAALERMG